MDKQCTQLTEQIKGMSIAVQHRIPIEQHEASIRECQRYKVKQNSFCFV